MNPSLAVAFLYGMVITMVVMRLVHLISDKGTTFGECPYCRKEATIKYETMYECSECKTRHTDDELKEKAYDNDQEQERELEREQERIRTDQRKWEYKEKLGDLNSEYRDIR